LNATKKEACEVSDKEWWTKESYRRGIEGIKKAKRASKGLRSMQKVRLLDAVFSCPNLIPDNSY